jgi:hypothetical protein
MDERSSVKRHIICGVPVDQTGREVGVMKAFVASLAAVAALLVAGTAAAYTTAPAAGTWVSLTRCFTQGSVTVQQGQYLRAAWGTVSQQQSLDFLAAQNLTLTVTSGASTVAAYVYPTGDTTVWTQPTLVDQPNTLNGNKPISVTAAFFQVNIAPGTYSLSTAGTSVNRAVFDGQSVVKKGQNWFPISGCTLIVT